MVNCCFLVNNAAINFVIIAMVFVLRETRGVDSDLDSGFRTRDLSIRCSIAELGLGLAKKIASPASSTSRFHAGSTIGRFCRLSLSIFINKKNC